MSVREPGIPRGLTPDEYKVLLQSVGTGGIRRNAAPLEVATLMEKARKAGETPSGLAQALHLDGPTMVSRFLRLLALNPHVHHLVHWGKTGATVAFSAAAEVARLPDANAHEPVFRAALEYGLSGAEVKAIIQQQLRSDKPIGDCIDDIVRMRPQVTTYHVVIGAVTSAAVRDALSHMTQRDRDELLRQALAMTSPSLRDIAARLGVDRFTLSYEGDKEARVSMHKQGLEARLTETLARLVGPTQGGVNASPN